MAGEKVHAGPVGTNLEKSVIGQEWTMLRPGPGAHAGGTAPPNIKFKTPRKTYVTTEPAHQG